MPESRFPIKKIVKLGVPYEMPGVNAAGAGRSPDSFIFRIMEPVPGSLPAWDQQGGHLVAFGNACTHMGCLLISEYGEGTGLLNYAPAGDGGGPRIVCGPCPCHGTSFDLAKAGLVILGPATQDLPQLALKRDGDDAVSTGWRVGQDPRIEQWPKNPSEGEGQ